MTQHNNPAGPHPSEVVLIVVDEILHTEDDPVCKDPTCPCQHPDGQPSSSRTLDEKLARQMLLRLAEMAQRIFDQLPRTYEQVREQQFQVGVHVHAALDTVCPLLPPDMQENVRRLLTLHHEVCKSDRWPRTLAATLSQEEAQG